MEKKSTVAIFLNHHIQLSGKKQKQIAEEVGFNKAKVITMIKQGKTKLPIARIEAMAKSIRVDAYELLLICKEEYQSEDWAVEKSILLNSAVFGAKYAI